MRYEAQAFQHSTVPDKASRPLRDCVRRALHARRSRLHAAVAAAGIASTAPLALGAAFPPVFQLADLYPPVGNGSSGFVLPGIDVRDLSGTSVSAAGDVNGDGIGDVIIDGARADPRGGAEAGEMYVVFGSTQGFPAVFPFTSLLPPAGDGSTGFVLTGRDGFDYAGISVSAAGDVNGDGINDLIIGAPHAGPDGFNFVGAAYVVFGSTQGFPAVFPLASLYPPIGDGSRGFVLTGFRESSFVGGAVSGAGDVNGDGIDDVVVGATADLGGHTGAGESYVVFGSTQGFPARFPLASLLPPAGDGSRGFVLTGVQDSDFSGHSLSAAGDVNGDGIDDLLIGAADADRAAGSEVGESYVVFGSTEPFRAIVPLRTLLPDFGGDGSRGFVLAGIDGEDRSGQSVSAAGDLNGDGLDDVIIGAVRADPDRAERAGESYVVFGSTQGFPAVFPLASLEPDGGGDGSRGLVLTGSDAQDYSGTSVSAAGDINADGIDDVIIGADGADPLQMGAGESYVVFGSTQGFPAVFPLGSLEPGGGGDGSHGFVLTGIDEVDNSGSAVSAAGDFNGDGIDDLVIGAPLADPDGDLNAGESYVVFGRAAAR